MGYNVTILSQRFQPNDYLWRYLDLHKFFSLIHEMSLHFSRMDAFEDPNEGISQSHLLRRAVQRQMEGTPFGTPTFGIDLWSTIESVSDEEKELAARQKQLLVNSWFISNRESVGMWNLYARDNGVAIRIRPKKLISLFSDQKFSAPEDASIKKILIGNVEYHDFYDKDRIRYMKEETQELGFHKDLSFQHEREFRFLIKTGSSNRSFIKLRFHSFNELPFEVIFHPKMAAWQKDNIRRIILNAGQDMETRDSELNLR